jgi:hypothetical protein
MEKSIHMAKPTKTARAREGQIKPTPFTGDLKEAILAGLNAGPGGILGLLDKVALENPRLAGRARRYAEYFATQGGVLEEASPGKDEWTSPSSLSPPRGGIN